MNQKGSFSYFYVFIVLTIPLIIFFALGIPFIQTMLTALYEAGEPLIDEQATMAAGISDANIRAAMEDNITSQRNSIPDQIDILSIFYQYSWIIIIVIISVTLFIFARRQTEVGIG